MVGFSTACPPADDPCQPPHVFILANQRTATVPLKSERFCQLSKPQISQLSADQCSQRGVPPLVAHRQPGGKLPQLDLQEGVLWADSVKH
ncbi:hypothetical protein Q5P01_010425 [Channa striata]|uniref:Uncharacterized protein n=1 Tax=Channa striata TaxID=64152 RepID=A0AA88N2Z9_CHASR|nr:hypothetical protein Q5P01_010425 [Channa striata]